VAAGVVDKKECSFLKKRTKKRLPVRLGRLPDTPGRPRTQKGKSFLVLFFKKEHLPS
jgi:hypothetical protein